MEERGREKTKTVRCILMQASCIIGSSQRRQRRGPIYNSRSRERLGEKAGGSFRLDRGEKFQNKHPTNTTVTAPHPAGRIPNSFLCWHLCIGKIHSNKASALSS